MNVEAFRIFGTVELDNKQFQDSVSEVQRSTQNFATKLGDNLRSAGKTLSLALTVPITAFAVKSVAAFEEHQRAVAQTEAVLKSTGNTANVTAGQIEELTKQLGRKAAVDDDLVRSGANVLLTFTNISNQVGEGNDIFDQAVTVALDLSAALGTDMAGAATLVGKALNDPIAGLAALTRVGVQFTEQQKAQIETLVQSGDVLGAQGLILDQLRTKFEGSAEAQVTATARMKVALDDLAETFGTQLAPFVSKAADALDDLAQKFIAMGPAGQSTVAVMAGIAALAGPMLTTVASFATITSGVIALLEKSAAAGVSLVALTGAAAGYLLLAAAIGATIYQAYKLSEAIQTAGLATEDLTSELVPQIEQIASSADSSAEAVEGIVKALAGMNDESKTQVSQFTFALEQMQMAFEDGKVSAEEAAGVLDTLMPQTLRDLGKTGEDFVHGWLVNMAKIPESAQLAQASLMNFAGMTGQELIDWETQVASSVDIASGALRQLADDAHVTAEDVITAWREQLNAQRDFEHNVVLLTKKGLSEEAAAQILEGGADKYAGAVAALLTGSAREIKAFNRLIFRSNDQEVARHLSRTDARIAANADQIEAWAQRVRDGLGRVVGQFTTVATAAERMADRILTSIQKILALGQMGTIDLAISARIAKNANEGIIPMGAEGAIVSRPTLALIGEAGPEVVVPLNQMPGASPLPAQASDRAREVVPQALSVVVTMDRKTFPRQSEYLARAAGL